MAKRRANGDGNIRKRANGTWEARVMIDGKSKSVYGKTQNEVRKKLTEIRADVDNGTFVDAKQITVGAYMQEWLDGKAGIKIETYTRYERDIRLYIVPSIGKVKLKELRPDMLRKLYKQMTDKQLSDKTISNLHGTLHSALQQAVDDGLIKESAANKVKPPRSGKPQEEMHPFKDEQVELFLQAAKGNQFEALYYVAMFTGMRQGEIIGLTWDCIDFQRGTIHLYRQLRREEKKGGKYRFTSLKNKEERTFQAPDSVLQMLKRVKLQQAENKLKAGSVWTNTELVFVKEDGSHVFARTVYENFKRIVRSIGLPQVRFHDLRHPYVKKTQKSQSTIFSEICVSLTQKPA